MAAKSQKNKAANPVMPSVLKFNKIIITIISAQKTAIHLGWFFSIRVRGGLARFLHVLSVEAKECRMDNQQITKWQRIIGEEHAKRQDAEFKACALEEQVSELQDQLRKSNQYANFLDSKLADLDLKYTNTSNALHKIVAILKKAKLLIARRKQELQYLTSENAKLHVALQKKQALLQEQMLHNENHDRQVIELQRKINNLQNQLYAKQRGNTEIEVTTALSTNQHLADYFAYKIINAPDSSAQELKSEADFIAQIHYLEQQDKQ